MLKKFLLIIGLFIFIQTNVSMTQPSISATPLDTKIINIDPAKTACLQYQDVNPLDVVKNPTRYKGHSIRMVGIFDKFSVVGLDYKPAFRSSEDYILFLIRKAQVKDHIIPLSEMKLFMTRKEAEKYIDLDAGDEIQFTGKVFSTALGDPWIDVDSIKVLNKIKKVEEKSTQPK